MKLVNLDYKNQVRLNEGCINVIVIENPRLFYDYIEIINIQLDGKEGKIILSDEDNILSLEKNVFMVLSPIEIDCNSRKILSKLYSSLKEIGVGEDMYMETNAICSDIRTYMERLTEYSDYNIEYSEEIDFNGLLKLADVKLMRHYDNLLDKIVDYIEAMQCIMGMSVGIFVNLKSYLTKDEFIKLYEVVTYKKMHIILLESRQPAYILENENLYIIDDAGCEIY